jgi:ubiquinone biosynthesis monooxygenase Coq7
MILDSIDRVILGFDEALKTVTGSLGQPTKPSPADTVPEADLGDTERTTSASLMRVNHCGEVCAQALYRGQSLTSRNTSVQEMMNNAAEDETEHLKWCEHRLSELGSRVSYLNPAWYGFSFAIGAIAGLLGDRINLGFVAATEQEVSHHLEQHLDRLPASDQKSKALLTQMRDDELGHSQRAIAAGGMQYPPSVKRLMRLGSRLMTRTTYWV